MTEIDPNNFKLDVIIPAYNEEDSIGKVVEDLPKERVNRVIVCNNGSKDNTVKRALEAGAIVVNEPRSGYGSACLAGMKYIAEQGPTPDIIVFIDGDYSDYPQQLTALISPIIDDGFDLVIGSRVLGKMESGSMTPAQIFGNCLATNLIRLIYKYEFTDLGPFRAIRYDSLLNLNMTDPDFGWTVEMQVRAAKLGLRCTEVPVDYRKRIGKSKVSGTLRGTILAGHKILWTIFKLL